VRARLAIFFTTALVVIFGAVACGGGEQEEVKGQQDKAKVEEEVKKGDVEPVERTKTQDTTGQQSAPVAKYEDMPEDVKAKLPEEAKQDLKQDLPQKGQ
jgi:hypothetical protein